MFCRSRLPYIADELPQRLADALCLFFWPLFVVYFYFLTPPLR